LNVATPLELVFTLYVFLLTVSLTIAFLTGLFLFLSVTVTFLALDLTLKVFDDAASFGVALLTAILALPDDDL
jgi:hypothetical protein